MTVEIRVLGPLELRQNGRSITPTAPQQRRILALLLLHANEVVPIASLVRELWRDEPPPTALTTLQVYILQLRRSLGMRARPRSAETGKGILATAVGGYSFRVQPGESDLHAYDGLAAAGRSALARGDHRCAADALGRALALWRGPVLVDVQAGPLLEQHIVRLGESHLSTVVQHIEACLRLDRHLDVLGDLTALVAEHELHEHLHAQLMLALHRSGRRQEALALFHTLRARLVNELGLEPSQRVRALHQAILSDDPDLDRPGRTWTASHANGTAARPRRDTSAWPD